jgi:predicted NAD/FAD-binding protein
MLVCHLELQPAYEGQAIAETRKQKIAILGGGVGAMSAALELTSIPDWQERYVITVYQMGWRLGGQRRQRTGPQLCRRNL